MQNSYYDNGARLKTFCRSKKLTMPQTYFKHSLDKRYTWYSNDGRTKKVRDYVLLENYVQQYVYSCAVLPEFDFNSDHRLLSTEFKTPMTKRARRTPKRQKKTRARNVKALQTKEIRDKFCDRINSEFVPIQSESADKIFLNINDNLTSIANNLLPEKKTEKPRELWKDDNVLNLLISEREKMEIKSPSYIQKTKDITKRVKTLRNEKIKLEAEAVNSFSSKREIEQLCRYFKNDNGAFRNIKSGSGCDSARLREHFQEHFNDNTQKEDPIELKNIPEFAIKLQQLPFNINSAPPDKNEIVETLKLLKNGKSSSDIPSAYLKYAVDCEPLIEELEKLYNNVWQTNAVPSNWTHSNLIAIWKGAAKGKEDDPKAYRGLQIGSTFCKILVIIILRRLNQWYESQLLEQQHGFRSGRGTTDAIYILKRLQQIAYKTNKPVFVLFVDLTAAFDHIDRKWMFASIHQRLTPESNRKLFELLESIYKYTSTALKEDPAGVFVTALGVRQGGPESPTLFNLYIDYIMRVFLRLCKVRGIRFVNTNYAIPSSASTSNTTSQLGRFGQLIVDWAGYADDLALCFNSLRDLQDGLKLLDETLKRYSLTINKDKTKTMIMNFNKARDYPNSITTLDNMMIGNVEVFTYLGIQIRYDEATTGEAELNLRRDSAESKFYEHAKKFMNHGIYLTTRVQLLNSLVRSRLTYACQTWTLDSTQMDHLNSTYISFIRKMVRGGFKRDADSWSFQMTNNHLLRIGGTEDLKTFVATQQRQYIAHTIRKDDESMAKKLLFHYGMNTRRGTHTTLVDRVKHNEGCTTSQLIERSMTKMY